MTSENDDDDLCAMGADVSEKSDTFTIWPKVSDIWIHVDTGEEVLVTARSGEKGKTIHWMRVDWDERVADYGTVPLGRWMTEYMYDLNGSISSKFIDVQEDVEREVNGALEDFGKQLKKAIDEKLTQLKQYV